MKKKRIRRIIAVFILLPIAAVIGGSFYMLAFSLRPDAKMREKNATAYEYMYAEYPFLRPWVDSLQTAGALRDTVIADPRGGSRADRPHGGYRPRLYGLRRADADDRLSL